MTTSVLPTPDMNTLDSALRYAELGYSVFVLGHDKRPLANCDSCPSHKALDKHGKIHDANVCLCLTCHGFYSATTDVRRVHAMFTHYPNNPLAIRTGAVSRLLVIDAEGDGVGLTTLDEWESWTDFALPPTSCVRTGVGARSSDGVFGTGGMHLWYHFTQAQLAGAPYIKSGRALPSVDIKADAGYVLAPPTLRGDGGQYTFENTNVQVADDCENGVAYISDEMWQWLSTPGSRGTHRSSAWQQSAGVGVGVKLSDTFYREALDKGCPDGYRDVFLNRLCFQLRKKGISYTESLSILLEHWRKMAQASLGTARYECAWEYAEKKLQYVFSTVELDEEVSSDGQMIEDQYAVQRQWAAGLSTRLSARLSTRAGVGGVAPARGSASAAGTEGRSGMGEQERGEQERGGESAGATEVGDTAAAAAATATETDADIRMIGHKTISGTFDFTQSVEDRGLAERYVKLFEGKALYVLSHGGTRGIWHLWSEEIGVWKEDTLNRTYHMCDAVTHLLYTEAELAQDEDETKYYLKAAKASQSNARRKAMMELLRADPRMVASKEDFNTCVHEIVVRNGTLDLHTGKVRQSFPTDMNSRCADVAYYPPPVQSASVRDGSADVKGNGGEWWLGNSSDLLTQYLDTFLPDVVSRQYLFKVLGLTLLGHNESRLFIVLQGETTSGKSMLLEAIMKILGSGGSGSGSGGYATTASTSLFRGNQDDKPRPDVIRSMGTRIVCVSEASQAWELHVDQVKRITGGEPVSMRGMRSDHFIEVMPTFTPIIFTNEMPRVKGADAAFKRRLRRFKFNVTIPADQEDVTIKRRFLNDAQCMEALFSMLVSGCLEAQAKGVDDMPSEYALDTMGAYEELDHTEQFISFMRDSELISFVNKDDTPTFRCVSLNDFHRAYAGWLRMHGTMQDNREKIGLNDFNRKLRGKGWESQKSHNCLRWKGVLPSAGFGPEIDEWLRGL